MTAVSPLLEVEDLHVEFRTPYGVVNAVNGISYTVRAGETLTLRLCGALPLPGGYRPARLPHAAGKRARRDRSGGHG